MRDEEAGKSGSEQPRGETLQAELERYKEQMKFMEEQIRRMEEEKKASQASQASGF